MTRIYIKYSGCMPDEGNHTMIDRRDASGGLQIQRRTVVTGLVAAGLAAAFHSPSRSQTAEVIVETTHGKLRGNIVRGVQVFRGIPYAASTGGENRFRPPMRVDPWSGIRDAVLSGQSAPQAPPTARPFPELDGENDARH